MDWFTTDIIQKPTEDFFSSPELQTKFGAYPASNLPRTKSHFPGGKAAEARSSNIHPVHMFIMPAATHTLPHTRLHGMFKYEAQTALFKDPVRTAQ